MTTATIGELDLEGTREELVKLSANGTDQVFRRLTRQILLDTYRSLSLGHLERPAKWLDVVRRVPKTEGTTMHAYNTLVALEDQLGLVVAAVPRVVPPAEQARTVIEKWVIDALDRAPNPFTYTAAEIDERLPNAFDDQLSKIVYALHDLADRNIVIRVDAERWQLSPRAKHLATVKRAPKLEPIAVADCKPGHVYVLKGRNLAMGVFIVVDASTGRTGFLGIRTKLGHRYLYSEDHVELGLPYGTASPLRDFGKLPDGVFASSYLFEGRPVRFWGPEVGWRFADTGARIGNIADGELKDNVALFNWLTVTEKELTESSEIR